MDAYAPPGFKVPFALRQAGLRVVPQSNDGSRQADPPAVRIRLWELPLHFLCSIVGTCLSTAELRKIVGKALARDITHCTDVEVHTECVSLAA